VRPKFSPQDYHSQITGYSPAKKGKSRWRCTTAFNPWLGKLLEFNAPINEYRPLSCKFDDTERADAKVDSAKAKLARMFANMVSWDIEDLPTWRDPDGTLWDPNTSITLIAPGCYDLSAK
jgi:prophage tail gpP-like protein